MYYSNGCLDNLEMTPCAERPVVLEVAVQKSVTRSRLQILMLSHTKQHQHKHDDLETTLME